MKWQYAGDELHDGANLELFGPNTLWLIGDDDHTVCVVKLDSTGWSNSRPATAAEVMQLRLEGLIAPL